MAAIMSWVVSGMNTIYWVTVACTHYLHPVGLRTLLWRARVGSAPDVLALSRSELLALEEAVRARLERIQSNDRLAVLFADVASQQESLAL